MKIKAKVTKFTDGRKIIEIPKSIRDNFHVGEEVFIEKMSAGAKEPKKCSCTDRHMFRRLKSTKE